MKWELIKSDFRKTALPYAAILAALAAYVLFKPRPLYSVDFAGGGLGLLQGTVLAWFIFRDSAGTESFILSRPLTRGRLFGHRFGLGIGLQSVTVIVLLVLIATGLRSHIQHYRLPYYPMIKWYEASIIAPVAVCGLIGFELAMFFILRGRIASEATATWRKITGRVLVVFGVVVILVLVMSRATDAPMSSRGWFKCAAWGYAAFAVILSTYASAGWKDARMAWLLPLMRNCRRREGRGDVLCREDRYRRGVGAFGRVGGQRQ